MHVLHIYIAVSTDLHLQLAVSSCSEKNWKMKKSRPASYRSFLRVVCTQLRLFRCRAFLFLSILLVSFGTVFIYGVMLTRRETPYPDPSELIMNLSMWHVTWCTQWHTSPATSKLARLASYTLLRTYMVSCTAQQSPKDWYYRYTVLLLLRSLMYSMVAVMHCAADNVYCVDLCMYVYVSLAHQRAGGPGGCTCMHLCFYNTCVVEYKYLKSAMVHWVPWWPSNKDVDNGSFSIYIVLANSVIMSRP